MKKEYIMIWILKNWDCICIYQGVWRSKKEAGDGSRRQEEDNSGAEEEVKEGLPEEKKRRQTGWPGGGVNGRGVLVWRHRVSFYYRCLSPYMYLIGRFCEGLLKDLVFCVYHWIMFKEYWNLLFKLKYRLIIANLLVF